MARLECLARVANGIGVQLQIKACGLRALLWPPKPGTAWAHRQDRNEAFKIGNGHMANNTLPTVNWQLKAAGEDSKPISI